MSGTFFHSIGSKNIRHTLLVTTLVALTVVVVSYVFTLSLQSKAMLHSFSTVAEQQVARLQEFEAFIQSKNAEIVGYITPFVTDTKEIPLQTIVAIQERVASEQAHQVAITLFSATGEKLYGNAPWVNNASTNAVADIQGQKLHYWFNIQTTWLVITYNMAPMLQYVQDSLSASSYEKTVTIHLPHTLPPVVAGIRKDSVNLYILGSNNVLEPSFLPATTSEFLLRKRPIVFTVQDSSSWQYSLRMQTAQLFDGARVLLLWLILFTLPLLLFASIIARRVGRSITEPIYEIADKLQQYRPNEQEYNTSVHSRDELQELDVAIAGIAGDLSKRYQSLENTVERTAAQVMQYSDTEHAIFDAISLGIAVVDTQGVITEANRTIAILLHSDIKSLVHTSIFTTLQLHKKDEPLSKEEHPVSTVLQTQRELRIHPDEHMSVLVHHNKIPLRLFINPIQTQGEFHGAVVVIQDASDEYKVEQLKSDFIAVASHQLRTPLATIQWYSELLSSEGSENFTNTQREFMVELRLAAQKLGNVINELMDASRLHDGNIEVRNEGVQLHTVVRQSMQDLESVARIRQIEFSLKTPEQMSTIQSDPLLLGVILQNILTNAIKYSKPASTVAITIEETTTEVLVHIADSGIGIPHKDKDYIFQKMYRGSNAKNVATDGSGLGLYATRKIVRLLSGSIHFTSEEGVGTTFTVRLPKEKPLL